MRLIIKEDDIQNIGVIYNLLKNGYKDMMQEMLESEMNVFMDYTKYENDNLLIENRRNGYAPNAAKASMESLK